MDIPKIPGYEILEALPRGGMSVVFKARQLSLNRIVALKTLPDDLVRDAADIEQFLAEARVTANLAHHNIVRVYDFGKTKEGVYYFAMHYVKGLSIASWIRNSGFLSENDTLMVAKSITEALDYAWQEVGVIHCDIKPANVIIDGDGTVKVVDLGVAQSINHVVDNKKTEENVIAGTPEYMAPEQVRGEYPLDSRVDIYALGAMMYHCLTGIKPFDGHPQEYIMALQEKGFIQDPQDIRPELSVAISCLMETFMAKDRKFRHANWIEAEQDIKRVRKGQLPDRLLPPDGISTVQRSPARDRRIKKMKRVPPKPEATQTPPPVYDLFSPDDQTITDKTAKKQMLPIKAKWVFAGFLGLAIAVLIGLVLENMRISRNSRTSNTQITTSGDRSPASKPTPSPSTPSISPSYVGREQTIENELKVITDKADELANQGHLLEAAKLLNDYSGPWRNETLKERERRASEYKSRFKLQKEKESADRLLPMLMKDIASYILQGDIDTAENKIQDALQDPALASRQPDLSRMADQLNQIRRVDKRIISSFAQQIGQETETALLKGWLLWQAGDWPGAEKQWTKSNTGLSQAFLDAGREQHKYDENKAAETKLTQMKSSPTPPAVTAKPETDITWLKNMLLEHNPKLTPEQITVQSLDGKVVRLEIISLYVRDISSVRELADLEELVCIAFKPNENIDSAKSAPIKDLTPLKGLRLRELNLFGTNVKDLAPLQNMPLEVLNIANTNVKDLTPLKNLPLKSLNIKQTAVRDITPILNLPIERIWLDFSPSKRPRETDHKFWGVLRRMHSLKFINGHAVAEFKEKPRKTET